MKDKTDNLNELISSWKEVPAPGGQLAGAVWQRIEGSGGKAGWFSRLVVASYDMDAWFARPKAVAALVVAGLMIGVSVAGLRTMHDASQLDHEMSDRYLSMLDTSSH